MELLEHVPGGLVTVGVLGVILAVVIFGFIAKAMKLAVVGLVVFLALGGWAYFEATSERAQDALEQAKEAAERVEKGARKIEKRVEKIR